MAQQFDLSKVTPSEIQENQIKINQILGEGRFILIGLHAGVICGFNGPEAVDVIEKSLSDMKEMMARHATNTNTEPVPQPKTN